MATAFAIRVFASSLYATATSQGRELTDEGPHRIGPRGCATISTGTFRAGSNAFVKYRVLYHMISLSGVL
ncbi:hypothetical protein AB1286_23400 [Trinickia sp. NRRL B-1857]|uniref:hypothetical protein n=1 Tax=Trinickia sp. NRRL B-1857 TaxID=3162879 RepID=UPI003D2E4180